MALARPNPDGVKAALARNAAKHKQQATDLASRILAESNDPATRVIVEAWEQETGLSVRRAGPAPANNSAQQPRTVEDFRKMSRAEIEAYGPERALGELAGSAAGAPREPQTIEDVRRLTDRQIVDNGWLEKCKSIMAVSS